MKNKVIQKTALVAWAMLCFGDVAAQDLPTMGWSSWNTFALNISEQIIKEQAAAMRQSGLLKAATTTSTSTMATLEAEIRKPVSC